MPKSATLGHQLSQWFQDKEIEDWKGFILNLLEQEKTNVYNLIEATEMKKQEEKEVKSKEASPGGSVVKKEQDEHKKKKKNTEEKAEAEHSCSVVKKEHD